MHWKDVPTTFIFLSQDLKAPCRVRRVSSWVVRSPESCLHSLYLCGPRFYHNPVSQLSIQRLKLIALKFSPTNWVHYYARHMNERNYTLLCFNLMKETVRDHREFPGYINQFTWPLVLSYPFSITLLVLNLIIRYSYFLFNAYNF